MPKSQNVADIRSWSSVGRWTLFGTLACVLASVTFSMWMLGTAEARIVQRVLISATVLPVLLGAPLFFYFSLRLRELAIVNTRLGRVARTDSLTACLNRGAFTTKVDSWLDDDTVPTAGALLMIDADNFKSINDHYGHDIGDEALTIIARSIRAVLRSGDIVGRMGGEEFAVFLPGVNQSQTKLVAERIRTAVNHAAFKPDGKQRPLSVSIGGAVFGSRTSFSELFRLADQRLYGAKHAGRNTATIAQVEDNPKVLLKRAV